MEKSEKSPEAYRTISEVSESLDVPQHVLRFWETRFPQVAPMKRAGNRRYYKPDHIELLTRIRDLLYIEGYTTKGVQKLLEENRLMDAVQSAESGKENLGETSVQAQTLTSASDESQPGQGVRIAQGEGASKQMLLDLAKQLHAARDRLAYALQN